MTRPARFNPLTTSGHQIEEEKQDDFKSSPNLINSSLENPNQVKTKGEIPNPAQLNLRPKKFNSTKECK